MLPRNSFYVFFTVYAFMEFVCPCGSLDSQRDILHGFYLNSNVVLFSFDLYFKNFYKSVENVGILLKMQFAYRFYQHGRKATPKVVIVFSS